MKSGRLKLIIAVLAVILALSASSGVALAYFSDYEPALGERTLLLNDETQIEEEVTDTEKTIKIVNTGKSAVVVRVAIYGPEGMKVEADSHWKKSGDYYYYDQVLAPGESTTSIKASIADIPVTADMEEFEIIVNHESAIATYQYIDGKNVVQNPPGWNLPTIVSE